MINNTAILLSILATAYVLFRAIQLDKTLPWFGKPQRPPPADRTR